MLSCEGYKMFLGTMKIKPKNANISAFEVYGHWLYKADTNCWYCNGSSYSADICEVVTDHDIYVTEVCPHCDTEQTISWDVTEKGYKAFCPTCGKELLLCSECEGSQECGQCDWSEETGCKMSRNAKMNHTVVIETPEEFLVL